MSEFFPVFKLLFLTQCLIRLNKVKPPALNLIFLALKFFHIDLVGMVLLAEPAVGFSDGQSIKGAIIFDMK